MVIFFRALHHNREPNLLHIPLWGLFGFLLPWSSQKLAIFEFARVFGYKGIEVRRRRLITTMFALLFDLEDYATTYRATRDAYLKAANELKLATGPYKASRDAYVAATATYTKSLYE